MGDTTYDDLHADDTSVSENPLVGRLERELASLRAEKERAEAERDDAIADATAVRELMNCYNLGGWTDSVSVMQRALKAEAERDAALKDADDRLRKMLATQAAHVRDNSNRLEVFAGMQDEARCRRLAASYLDELSVCIDLDAAIDAARKGEQ